MADPLLPSCELFRTFVYMERFVVVMMMARSKFDVFYGQRTLSFVSLPLLLLIRFLTRLLYSRRMSVWKYMRDIVQGYESADFFLGL